jgi:hypothetical protein
MAALRAEELAMLHEKVELLKQRNILLEQKQSAGKAIVLLLYGVRHHHSCAFCVV